ncbi:sulfatase family protein [Rubrobacter tropicus]|nr:sulfatase [Rubrobacter tropicus]
MTKKAIRLLTSVAVAVFCALVLTVAVSPDADAVQRPNIILIMTDDQSADTLWSMNRVRAHLLNRGTKLTNARFAFPRCCPSRASILRGQYPHNTGLFANENGSGYFRNRGLDRSTVAVWLDRAGYDTALIGKYLNGHDQKYVPPGWDRWFSQGGGNSRTVNDDGEIREYGSGTHMDSVRKREISDYVRLKASTHRPFFLQASFFAPHAPYDHQSAYEGAFANAPFPRPPAYDEADVSDKPAYVRSKPRVSEAKDLEYARDYRDRLRALQTVDESIAEIVGILQNHNELNDTYIVLWTDNGYHMGEHRLSTGKLTPYETDTNFPMIVRGPGIRQGVEDDRLVLNTDLAPTFLAWANVPQQPWTDGRPMEALLDARTDPATWRRYVLLEGRTPDGNGFGMPDYAGVLSQEGEKYIRYASGEQEYYDLRTDPHELESRPEAAPQALKDALEALRTCAGPGCRTAENGPTP